jgi:hypothetical protein
MNSDRLISLLLLAVVGCTTSSPGLQVAAVAVLLPATLIVGDRRQADVAITTSGVATAASPKVIWETSDASIVRVDGAGYAEAVGAGLAYITARANGISGTARVAVVPAVGRTRDR